MKTYRQGITASTRTTQRQALAVSRVAEQRDALCQALAMASIAANQAGDRASAHRLLDEARRTAADLDDLGATLMVHQAQALNALHDGEFDTVQSAATEGVRLSREAGDLYSLTMMGLNQGFAALRSDDVREAERRFTEALPIARRLDDRVAQCYLLGGLGSCAAASHEPRPAAQLLGAMENLRAELGAIVNPGMAPALSSATESVLTALGPTRFAAEFQAGQRLSRHAAVRLALKETAVPTAAAVDDNASGALGKREADVARLVAQGLSNKEVGARLFISERTVETHVRNILNKLGFKSRAQIAGWMATQ